MQLETHSFLKITVGVCVCETNQFNNLIDNTETFETLKKKYKCVLCLIKIKHYLLSYKHWAINKGAIIHITYPLLTTVKVDLWCKGYVR